VTAAEIGKIVDQVFRLVYVARNVAHHRSLESFKDDFEQNYWILAFNNFLDIAVLEWCKAFGSKSEATHWSKHVKDPDVFRAGLFHRLTVSEDEWRTYWESIKNYRDEVVAHHESASKVTHYPDFGHALKACFYYYEILITELRVLHVSDYPDNLEDYFESSLAQAKNFSEIAYRATRALKENVY
jgi:hypothetical protein